MVTKSRKESNSAKTGKVKVPKLKLQKETVKNLQDRDLKKIKGGVAPNKYTYTCFGCTQLC